MVIQGRVVIDAGAALLLWFSPGSMATSGAACIPRASPDGGKEIFVDPSAAPGTWWPGTQVGPDDTLLRTSVDDALREMLLPGRTIPSREDTDVTPAVLQMLGLGTPEDTSRDSEPTGGTEGGPGEVPEINGALTDQMAAVESAAASASQHFQTGKSDSSAAKTEILKHDAHPGPAATPPRVAAPAAYVGWSEPAARYCLVGTLVATNEPVALDLDNPKAIGVFGYMGSGKSYLLGTLVESSVVPIAGINSLPAPLSVVIFNYRRQSTDRFELSSLSHPKRVYQASPRAVDDIHILCLPGQLSPERIAEYGELPASELFFDSTTLGVEDWELLMGEPGSNAVFARAIRNTLMDLQASGDISLENLERSISHTLNRSSQLAAQLRLDFVRRYLSTERGLRFGEILRPGRAVIFDLRQPLFNKDDALRFFLVCANHISQVQGGFNKLVVFDEAHEYMSDAFGEKIEARIRLMRHEGTSYVFATQDVGSIPLQIRRFITTRFVFSLGTRDNVNDLVRFAPEFTDIPLQQLSPGTCYVQSIPSQRNLFARPRLIQVRPRVTQHGGTSRIFSGDTEEN
jgi:DNA phosphorothioation-dependent restriction protein DptH